jgi:uncharacterized protein (DUF302 family)
MIKLSLQSISPIAGQGLIKVNSMNGLITVQIGISAKEAIDRIANFLNSKNLPVFARIDHAANAQQAGLFLRPTELIVFGNPKAGTLVMQDKQTSGIDLPLKILAWEDGQGKSWITYNDPAWIWDRHELKEKNTQVLKGIEQGLKELVDMVSL